MKNFFYCTLIIIALGFTEKEKPKYADYPISTINIKDIVINDDFWLPMIKTVQQTTIKYAFDKCQEEGRMENFLIAGGKKKGKKLGNFPFDDSDLYKIIEGASNTLISAPNSALDAYLDSIIAIIKIGQAQDGYLSTWYSIDPSNPGPQWFKPSKSRWDHEDSNHELYNSGHLFEAAATHYWATGKRNFLDIALANADLLVANFGTGKLQIPPGHQIIETGLIKLYRISKNEAYLKLAKQFLDWRGDSATHQLYGAYSQDMLPVTQQTEAVGHAVRAVYMYAGMTDIAAIYNDALYKNAIDKIWDNVVNGKTYITGGIGSHHGEEKFGENYELPNLSAYNETCASIGSVYWNQRMFLLSGNSKYIDVLERTLYNGLISGLSIDGKKFFYPNPLESDGKYNFNQGACTRSDWFDCSCCPTNLIRFLPSLPNLIYAQKNDSLYTNLFVSNKAKMHINNQPLEIVQRGDYPNGGKIKIEINPERTTDFTLMIRVPGWAKNMVLPGDLYQYVDGQNPKTEILINKRKIPIVYKNGYVCIKKQWNKGDNIEINFPFKVRKVKANDKVKDNNNKIALEYGPLVYCAEGIDNKDLSNIKVKKDENFSILKSKINTTATNILKGKKSGLMLIPYYLWANRGVNAMKVWFPYDLKKAI